MANEAASRLLVSIEANTEKLRRELKGADSALGQHDQTVKSRLASTRKQFAESAARVAKWGAAVGVAAAAAGAAMVKSGLKSVDSLAKTSDKLGIATEELAKLRFAAEQTGVSSNTLDMALQRMTRRVAEAGQGTGEAVKALEELGLNAKELADMSPDEVFREVTRAMEGVDRQSDKVRLAFKLFDSEGVALVNTLGAGVDGLDRFGAEAEAAGLAISRDMAAKVEGANDALNRVSKMTEGFSQQLAVKFAPALEAVASNLFDMSTETTEVGTIADKVFSFLIKAAGHVANAFRGLEIAFLAIKAGVAAMAAAVLTHFDTIYRGISYVADQIPGVDIEYEGSSFARFVDSFQDETFKAADAVRRKLEEPLPSVAIEKLSAEWEKKTETIVESTEKMAVEVAESYQDSADAAEIFDDVMGDLGITSALMAGTVTASHQDVMDMIDELAGATESSAVVAETAHGAIADSSESMATIVSRGFERMRDGVGDFFTDLLVDGKASFDGLLDMFKRIIAEMIATAATNRIMLSLGIGGGSSAAMASGGASGGIGGMISGASSLFGGGSIGSQIISGFGSGLVQTGDAVTNLLGIGGTSTSTAMLVGGATSLAGGAIGGWAGTELGSNLFGKDANSNAGATIGAAIGTAILPGIGSVIGGFLGGMADSLFGSSNRENLSEATFSSGMGPRGDAGTIDFYNQGSSDTRKAVADIGAQLELFVDALGGSTRDLTFGVSDQRGLFLGANASDAGGDPRFNGFTIAFKDDIDGFMRAAVDQLIAGADDISDVVIDMGIKFSGSAEEALAFVLAVDSVEGVLGEAGVNLVQSFQGSSQEMLAYASALSTFTGELSESQFALISSFSGTAQETLAYIGALSELGLALDVNPVQAARDIYSETNATLVHSYEDQADRVLNLAKEYDASLSSTQALSFELDVSQKLAFQLATQLMAVSGEIQALTESSAESIRQSVMSEGQLREARKQEINALVQELEVLSDPDEIKATVARIEQLNRLVFNSLGPEAQQQQAEAFAGFIEQVNDKAQERLAEGIAELERTQETINATIGDALDGAAATMSGAASMMLEAAQTPQVVEVKIPGYAGGGMAKPGLAIVGEQGPELVRFNRPGFVHTASETRSMLSGGGDDVKAELQSLAVMMSRQLKLWQRVTRNGETLRTTAA